MKLALVLLTVILLTPVPAHAKTGPILVTATLLNATQRDVGPAGKLSDATEQRYRVNDRNGRPVGRLLLACRWVSARSRLCNGELKMPLGKITVAGSSLTALDGEFAVTGGVGAYEGAQGAMDFTSIGRGKLVLFVQLT